MSESALTLISGAGRDGVPSLFARHDAVFAEGYAGIVENKRRTGKGEAAVSLLPRLFLINPVLLTVPLKPHRYTNCITPRMRRSNRREYCIAAARGSSGWP